jgi:hypothetical protein
LISTNHNAKPEQLFGQAIQFPRPSKGFIAFAWHPSGYNQWSASVFPWARLAERLKSILAFGGNPGNLWIDACLGALKFVSTT